MKVNLLPLARLACYVGLFYSLYLGYSWQLALAATAVTFLTVTKDK